ncbi:uncharacterized protein KGF55_000525 [Candida pseudojiufengensis]|uniref:uncharacterized protein n=1 Tax=Candida pseudojiufengensis TaxID=497109 RepID=UPI0022248251|nr:uncharacterized protein KGF55_000525 [Candida pseudojiufengensis]KAI5966216.1 hypothetical protein KGF55_000525 [Candida pseudojiufengensis]
MSDQNNEIEPHIAVLVLDTPIPTITEKYGDFGDNTIDLLEKNSPDSSITPPYKLKKYQLKNDNNEELEIVYENLKKAIQLKLIHGFILTGSGCDAFGEYKWLIRFKSFLKNVLINLNKPIVGICFGHQLIALILGCKIDRNNEGWELGITTININDEIYKIKNSPFLELNQNIQIDNNMDSANILFEHLNLVEFHQDIIYGGIPQGFINFGSTSKCSIQGMISIPSPPPTQTTASTTAITEENNELIKKPNYKILTFQGHPEFTTSYALDLLKYKFEKGLFNELTYEKAKYHTSSLNNQGDLIGKVICKFLYQED